MSMQLLNINPYVEPLDTITITAEGGSRVVVRDSKAQVYAEIEAAPELSFPAGGALGTHTVTLEDAEGRPLNSLTFEVDCQTSVEDESGLAQSLLEQLHWTLESWLDGKGNDFVSRFNDKTYRYFVCWLRDHVHTLKGQKWFHRGELKTAIELYADTQREDGMVFDRCGNADPNPTWRDHSFREGDFIKAVGKGKYRMERIPVENDVEYLFLEGLYVTWKATGDSAWMSSLLDNAVKAVDYAMHDRYRWSNKFQLLKRGYTIDTWDFMHSDDELAGSGNCVDVDNTVFGVMFGDNTGMAAALEYLAEMLETADRHPEAITYRQLAGELRQRLYDVSWNGEFFTHHVSEDPSFVRDFGGTDPESQVSLSNSYSLNRNIGHDKCTAIIRSYQRIKDEMPKSSPGEYYHIYPPFERGFGGHNDKWHYMNGGVSSIVAGELSKGAFDHGYESYGYEILERIKQWADDHDGVIPVCLRGAKPEAHGRIFTALDIRDQANVDLVGTGDKPEGILGWTDEGENDLRSMPTGKQEFLGIEFDVIDPACNGRKACIGLRNRDGYAQEATVAVGQKAASLYTLHTLAGGGYAGEMRVRYADGEENTIYVNCGNEVNSWFLPKANWFSGKKHQPTACLAWQGPNPCFDMVGVYAWGWNNPRPDAIIEEITFSKSATDNTWFILGITACDHPVLFPTTDVSFGIPTCWGASAVVYALLEGLAGVQDRGVGMDKARIVPRWAVTPSKSATVTARYASATGYSRYRYEENDNSIALELTGSATEQQVDILLPAGKTVKGVSVDGNDVAVTCNLVEDSVYASVELSGVGVKSIKVELA